MHKLNSKMIVAFVALFAATSARAQDQRDSPTMQALLSEVRQLRIALEQSALTVPRIQILLQRSQMQQGRVDRLTTNLRELRGKINAARDEVQRRLIAAEERVRLEQNPERRREFQMEVEEFRAHMQTVAAGEQQQRLQESEIASELNAERAKLEDLERQLRTLESSLAPSTTK